MKLVALLALLFCAGITCRAADTPDLVILLATQDANGMHYVIVSTKGTAVVHTTPPGQSRIDHSYDYDAGRAVQLWTDIDQLAKDGLADPTPGGEANAHAEENYLIILKGADGSKKQLVFSKCKKNPRVDDTMQRLTNGLLPAGSPGIRPGACAAHTRPASIDALAEKLPVLCTKLRKQGWLPPAAPLDGQRPASGEAYAAGKLYMCMLEHDVPGRGPGHKPLLQVLMSDLHGTDGPSVVFSARIWCDADRKAALGALADTIEHGFSNIALSAPAPLLEAVRNGQTQRGRGDGFGFHTELKAVDPQACGKVGDGQLGAVSSAFDVGVELDGVTDSGK